MNIKILKTADRSAPGAEERSVHDEETQKVLPKPSSGELEKGVLKCRSCGTLVRLDSVSPLTLCKCVNPACSSMLFIPMRIKDYWLYEPLGGGGMGSVYHAFNVRNPNAEFAVKILPRQRKNNNDLIETLLKEAQVGSEFGFHPHISKVYEYGCSDGEYFASYEFVEGIRLDRIIESPVRRSDKEILLWSLQILSAEQHMFNKGYLFRDLKPQNVIIDTSGNVKMIDFGLVCKVEESKSINAKIILGSPYYMPPERIIGEQEGQYSEIYSLGMLLYHMMTGKTFYSSDDVKGIVEKHVFMPHISSLSVKFTGNSNQQMVSVLEKMILRDPQRRIQSYKEAGAMLFNLYKACA
ncbi:MAG TPA: serine/threonine-protein kinase [Victivallales bacterium]|nr:serine/threonine-protein kinase [Victivallales bacterium]